MTVRPKLGLSYRIASAFHQACDQSDYEVASQLLQLLEIVVRRPNGSEINRRRGQESLIAAHERYWCLQQDNKMAA